MPTGEGQFTGNIIGGDYRVTQRLGEGGMGEAYRAEVLIHQNDFVVIKFLTQAGNPKEVALFTQEAEVHRKLKHDNIIPFRRFAVHKEGSREVPYIVMALAPEGSLEGLLKKQGLLPLEHSIDILLQVADGLEYAHARKVLHRDIKPANVLLDKERRSKQFIAMLSDFGIAITGHRLDSIDITSELQKTVRGTLPYMPPEQFLGDPRFPSDIYQLGVMAYLLLTGRLPVQIPRGATIFAAYMAHLQTAVPPFSQVVSKITPPLEAVEEVIGKSLAKSPEQRHQSAGAFRAHLDERYRKGREEEARGIHIADMHPAGTPGPKTQEARQDPNNPAAQYEKGNALAKQGKYEEAIEAYDRAIALNPGYAAAYNSKGVALQDLKKYEEAVEALDRAIALNPGYATAYYSKGVALRYLKKYEEAVEALDRAIALNPGFADAYNNKGNALMGLKKYEAAIVAYDRAIALNPGEALAYYHKGLALRDLKKYEEAIGAFDQVIRLDPNDFFAQHHKNEALKLISKDRKSQR